MDTHDSFPTVAAALARLMEAEADIDDRDLDGTELDAAVLRLRDAKRRYDEALERARLEVGVD